MCTDLDNLERNKVSRNHFDYFVQKANKEFCLLEDFNILRDTVRNLINSNRNEHEVI